MYLPERFNTRADAARHILRTVHETFPKDSSRISDGPFSVIFGQGQFLLMPFGSGARHRYYYFVDWDAQNEWWIFHVGLNY